KWTDVELADIDKDGDLDAVLSGGDNSANSKTEIYLNNGSGGFSAVPVASLAAGAVVQDAAVGDLNGDGNLDIYQANVLGADRIWFGDGAGGFTLQTVTASVGSAAVELADLDGDGDLDALVTAFDGQGFDRILINDGNGTFTLGQQFSTTGWGVALGELNH